ncbi:peptidase [Bacteroidales bacterium]|nr:peptidase [Bacteroidales bacterium]
MVYAVSGIAMNHLKDFNPQYMIVVKDYKASGDYPQEQDFTKERVLDLLSAVGEEDNYTKHYYPNKSTMKVFLKSGSSFGLDTQTGEVKYEALKKRPIFSQLSFLHYNPGRWWTIFSDIFAICLIIICLSGIFMGNGRSGLKGIGGLELFAGALIPLLFLFLL